MNDKTKNVKVNPYDLSAMRRNASAPALKTVRPMRQPYSLASSQRLVKSTVVVGTRKAG